MIATVLVTILAAAAGAGEPSVCPAITWEKHRVKLESPVAPGSKAATSCMEQIARVLATRAQLETVTVGVYAPDEVRVGGKALAFAKQHAEELGRAGVKAELLSAVAYRLDGNRKPDVVVTFSEAPPRVVAVVQRGEGSFGDAKRALGPGHLVVAREKLFSNGGAMQLSVSETVTLKLESGASAELSAPVDENKARIFGVLLHSGELEGTVQGLADKVRVSTPQGEVTFTRGRFRVHLDEKGAHAEVLEGQAFAGAATLGANQGLVLGKEVVKLPAAPQITAGSAGAAMAWTKVEGASGYRVELSRDVQFVEAHAELLVSQPTAALPGAKGRWFWRVASTTADGLKGADSKIYAVEVK